MRIVKHRREEFLLFDYAGVEKHLEKMAAKGWQLMDIEMGFWTYERKDPAKIRYSVTYIPTASAFDPVQTDDKDQMDAYCNTAGWKKVADWAQMQIYCTEDPDAVELETDERSRLDVIRKSMRKTFLISNMLLLLVFVIQGCSQIASYRANSIRYLAQNQNLILLTIIVAGFSFVVVSLVYYWIWLYQSQKFVENGGHPKTVRFYRPFAYIGLGIVILLFIAFIMTVTEEYMSIIFIGGMLGLFLIMYLVNKTSWILKKRGVDQILNKVITLAVDFVLVIIFFVLLSWVTRQMILKEDEPFYIYTINGDEWPVYHEEIPVHVEDIADTEYDHYSYLNIWEDESILLGYGQYLQISFPDGENAPELDYEIINVKTDVLYDMCLERMLSKYDYDNEYGDLAEFRSIDVAESDEITQLYRMTYDGEFGNEWIICNEQFIISAFTEWEMTEEQMDRFIKAVSK